MPFGTSNRSLPLLWGLLFRGGMCCGTPPTRARDIANGLWDLRDIWVVWVIWDIYIVFGTRTLYHIVYFHSSVMFLRFSIVDDDKASLSSPF